jgi:hypothetical protein
LKAIAMLIYLVALLLAAHVFVEAQTGETPAYQQSQPPGERGFPDLINVGSIKGVVIDQEGKPVSDAWASAKPKENMLRPIHVKTDANGQFLFSGLPVGVPFRLSVGAPGYEPWHHDSITMKTMTVSIHLKKSRQRIPNLDKHQ